MLSGKGQYSDVEIDGETFQRVLEFIYLGSCKTSDCKPDIMRRIAQAKLKMIDFENSLRNRDLSTKLKLRIIKVLVWTTVIYGGTSGQERKRKFKQLKCGFTKGLNITWKTKEHTIAYLMILRSKVN